MNSLVANYGTSSSESEADKSDDEVLLEENKYETQAIKLPKPDFNGASSKTSVFSNPFVEAENAKKAILEKHVKMVPTKGKVEMINGKKICWNYRKGRCHFGHNCTFAHDTDLQRSAEEPEADHLTQFTLEDSTSRGRTTQISGVSQPDEVLPETLEDKWENQAPARKKRPGLTPGLIPSKKAKKNFRRTNNSNLL